MKLLPIIAGLSGVCCFGANGLFLNLDGIPGESTDGRHANWIELASFAQGVEREPTNARPSFSDVSVVKRLDRSSSTLFLLGASGKSIKSGRLEMVQLGETQLRFLQLKLANLKVRTFAQTGAGGVSPTEQIAFGFDTVEWTYTQFDGRGGVATNIVCSWNRVTGTGIGGSEEPMADGDADGMPDEYERLYGLNLELDDAGLDFDRDGVSNLDEFRAGTFPNERDSVFQMRGRRSVDNSVVLTWTPAPGKVYRVLSAPSPEGPFQVQQVIDGGTGEFVTRASAGKEFFILHAEPAE